MTYQDLKTAFVQGGERESTQLLHEVLRGCVREALWNMMNEEVESLCGPRYHPDKESQFQRAGSEKGTVFVDGEKTEIKRPRVRHNEEGEVTLETYRAASSQAGLFEEVVTLVAEGMSQRGLARASQGNISRSSISRMWEEKSREQLALLRERPLKDKDWVAIMIDGVFLGGETCLVLSLGIDAQGRKHMLDFEPGTSESQETVSRLLGRLQRRGIAPSQAHKLLVVRDGSEAIKSALKRVWPEALQQTCLIHLERNIRDRVRCRDRAELQRLFRQLRQAQGQEAGEEAFEDLREFLAERNAGAALALSERRDEVLTVHRLNVPATLNVTLLSTNVIENAIRNWREQTGQVKRWSLKNDMIERWAASGMLWAEAGFRRIRHYEDVPKLRAALGKHPEGSSSTAVGSTEPSSVPADPSDESIATPQTPS
ncbi:MAG: IS256 family transposase [Verrucomicrobiota bacterium]